MASRYIEEFKKFSVSRASSSSAGTIKTITEEKII
jgi:hypothetical protein